MAINRLFSCALGSKPFPLYGSGEQVRDFTYVSDVVDATVAASEASLEPGSVINITGGTGASMLEVISIVEELTGNRLSLLDQASQAGDVGRTGGSTDRARSLLGWKPKVRLRDGLERQLRWHRDAAQQG
jgi:nucleoside-diphosphate-sugar epimerase